MGIGRYLPPFVKKIIRGSARRAAGVRYSRWWPLARPFYKVARKFVDFDTVLGVQKEPKDKRNLQLKEIEKRQISRVRNHIIRLHQGFEEQSIREIDWFVNGPVTPAARSEAAWQLIAWHIGKDSEDDALKALPYLELLAGLDESTIDPGLVAAFKTEALLRLGRWEEARDVCMGRLAVKSKSFLKIAAANFFANPKLCPVPADVCENIRMNWINSVFRGFNLDKLHLIEPEGGVRMGNISGPTTLRDADSYRALVTVIIPAWNEESTIEAALRSLLVQSWRNMEILVVDDASKDNTRDIVNEMASNDPRIRLIEIRTNRGKFCAINVGLVEAKGDFVVWQDAHDFAHPRKIETMAVYMLLNAHKMACRSMQVKASPDLKFDIRGETPAGWMEMCPPMIRRKPVTKKIGFLDAVRFGGDDEFYSRLKTAFGDRSVKDLKTGFLTIAGCRPQNPPGFEMRTDGVLFGARREYAKAYNFWHKNGNGLYVDFPMKVRPFAVPEVMESDRPEGPRADRKIVRRYDVVYASDFRLPGGTTASTIEELRAQAALGLTTAMVRLDWYRARPTREMNRKFRKILEEGIARLVAWPEEIETDLVILPFPPPIIEPRLWAPEIHTKDVRIICNQPPVRGAGELAERIYYAQDVDRRVSEVFGVRGIWHPIGPVARHSLLAENADLLVSDEDWFRIIDVDEWTDNREGPVNRVPVIGRHGRDYFDKWPETAEMILQVYPEREDIKVSILGGANVPVSAIGHKPKNWTVYEFDSRDPKEYLKELDVFVYFPDTRRFEAFGRTVFEAMAVGVPAILPWSFKETFGDAALYCNHDEVVDIVMKLCSNPDLYRERVHLGREYVRKNYGYPIHQQRLEKILGRQLGPEVETASRIG